MKDNDGIGVVLRHEGVAVVVDLAGTEVRCVVRKSLRRAAGKRVKAVVVGDRVRVDGEGDEAAVVEVIPRRSELSRPQAGDRHRAHVLVANVDAVVIVAAIRQPDFAPGLVDRFLAAAELEELRAALVFNKLDLHTDEAFREQQAHYQAIGYPVFETCAIRAAGHAPRGIEALAAYLKDKTSVFVGHSGVGKSSLAIALDPRIQLRTKPVHATTGQGVHTTTTARLFTLPDGGYVVDTPGIRVFGLWDTALTDLGYGFREFQALLGACRFNDCLHTSEPGCAVQEAVDQGDVPKWRYDSYIRILESLKSENPDPW